MLIPVELWIRVSVHSGGEKNWNTLSLSKEYTKYKQFRGEKTWDTLTGDYTDIQSISVSVHPGDEKTWNTLSKGCISVSVIFHSYNS